MPNSSVIGTDVLLRKFKALQSEVQGEALANATMAGGLVIGNQARANILAQNLVRTRTLSRSITQAVEEKSETRAVVAIGTNLEYAAIHEFGGTITPKTGKYLAIPISAEAKAAGSPKTFAGKLIFLPSNGGGVLVDETNVVHYKLTTSVTLPAKPYLRPAMDDKAEEANQVIGAALKQIIEKAAAE